MSHLYLLGVATLTLTSAGFAGSDTNADLQARIDAAVEARIAELTVGTNNNWLNDARSDEIRGLVHDVLADADTRASLQGTGSTAGYNDGFTVASADGNWSLKMNGLLQTSWSNVDSDITNDNGWGFNSPNSWMNFSGAIAGDFRYDVRYDWSNSRTVWANGSYDLNDTWALGMGSYKVATNRREMIDDQNQLTLMNQNVTGARAISVGNGVSLEYTGDQMRAWAQLYNHASHNPATNDSQYNANFRFEYMVEGNWGQFDEFTSADGGNAGTLIGVTYNWVNAEDGHDSDSTWTIDAQMQFGGSNLYVSYTDFDNDDDGVGETADYNTVVASYGIYFDADWEAYVQYVENDTWTGDEVWSIGVNNYWAGQNARWTTEITLDGHDADGDVTTISSQLQFYF